MVEMVGQVKMDEMVQMVEVEILKDAILNITRKST